MNENDTLPAADVEHTNRFKETQRMVRENDPPIELDQRWVAYDKHGDVFRRLRIVGKHVDDYWLFQDEPAKMKASFSYYNEVRPIPEFNLRYVFELELK